MLRYALAAGVALFAPAVLADPVPAPEPAPPATLANPPNRVEVRYASGEMEIEDEVVGDLEFKDSDGVDIRAHIHVDPQLFLRTELARSKSDTVRFEGEDFDVDSKTSFFRLGPGYQWSLGKTWIYASAEYLRVKVEAEGADDTGSGAIISGGFKDDGKGRFIWNVEIGILRVEDTDGAAFEFTLGWRATPNISILFGGQGMGFGDKDDDGQELSIGYGTLGLGYAF